MGALAWLDALPAEEAMAELLRCCGSTRWARQMTEARPFPDRETLLATADRIAAFLGPGDWREAFSHHPRIGDRDALRARFASTAAWAAAEQAGAAAAAEEDIDALAEGNRAYEERFGYIFIVCATGRTAGEMLALLRARLHNEPEEELAVAAREQARITHLRLLKLLDAHEEEPA
jgi:2-oxo-4-hydroxy-4-carboxy-5-ureidoimidazoline decarboxylase